MNPHACLDCLRRPWLLALLAPYIDRHRSSDNPPPLWDLLAYSDEALAETVAPKVADQLLTRVEAITPRRAAAELDAASCWATCVHDDLYPSQLGHGGNGPAALIGLGDPQRLAGLDLHNTVTIVGSRRATAYGREVARELGRDLARAGLTVVSGLAFGIDGCAHRGALEGGRTIAVLGCGPDTAYPAAHRSLWRRIGEEGLVLAELPPGAATWRWTFPARSRIMAALAGTTVVVEAAARSSALVAAELAVDLGRDVGAVPGAVTSRASAGPNDLLAAGALLVREAQDVLDSTLGLDAHKVRITGPPLDVDLAAVLAAVERGHSTSNDIAAAVDRSRPEVLATLCRLELMSYLACSAENHFSRTDLAPPATAS